MNEFALIDAIVDILGPAAVGPVVREGPGDDAAVISPPAGSETVSSIDTLLADVHFPATAPAELIASRAMSAALSDLVAMGAQPGYVLVATSLPAETSVEWVSDFARGLAGAATRYGAPVAGGNLSRGALSVTISVHGFVPQGGAVLRSGAQPGDWVVLTGAVGAANAALRSGVIENVADVHSLSPQLQAYYAPPLRFDLADALRDSASAAIDVSDGLLQDLDHVCSASSVGADLVAADVPLGSGAELQAALVGGDDYVVCFTTADEAFARAHHPIGRISIEPGIRIDGARADAHGYSHFDD